MLDSDPVEIQAVRFWEELENLTSATDPECEYLYRILHGVAMPAAFLPESFCETNVFVIFIDPEDRSQGVVVDMGSSSVEIIADAISKVMNDTSLHPFDISIENTYLFFGYDMTMFEETDDELVERAISMVAKIEDVKIAWEKTHKGENG